MAPNVNWGEVKQILGVRDSTRNEALGIVLTRPSARNLLVETVWKDHGDNGQHDGDITLIQELKPKWYLVRKLTPNDIRKEYPAWHPYHHEDKSYLE